MNESGMCPLGGMHEPVSRRVKQESRTTGSCTLFVLGGSRAHAWFAHGLMHALPMHALVGMHDDDDDDVYYYISMHEPVTRKHACAFQALLA